MDPKTKNVLGWAITLAVLAVGYAAISFSNSFGQAIPPSSMRTFSVTGQGKAIAIPDVAEFTFEAITQGGKDIASLQSQNTTAINKAIAFVKSEGVADKDIKTNYYNISPDYKTYNCVVPPVVYNSADSNVTSVQSCPPASIVGYTITQSVDVKVRDFTKIGDIMSGIVSNGANQIGQLSFTLDDPTSIQNAARTDAITKAKAEAETMATAGGFRLGKLLSVQEGSSYPYPVYANAMSEGLGGGAVKSAPTPTIQPGSEEVDMTETLQYEIQ